MTQRMVACSSDIRRGLDGKLALPTVIGGEIRCQEEVLEVVQQVSRNEQTNPRLTDMQGEA
jgi:hypothetical protein